MEEEKLRNLKTLNLQLHKTARHTLSLTCYRELSKRVNERVAQNELADILRMGQTLRQPFPDFNLTRLAAEAIEKIFWSEHEKQ